MGTSILVGIDGSIASRAAIEWAIRRAGRVGAAVELLTVLDDEWGEIGGRELRERRLAAERLAERELEFAREAAGTVAVTAALQVGRPMPSLATGAARRALVVVGTHKTGSSHGRPLGSRSMQLAALSPVPVAVAPLAASAGRRGVVVGLGADPGWLVPVRFAADEAECLGQPLVLVHSDRAARGDPLAAERVTRRLGALVEAARPPGGISVRRSAASAGEALAVASQRAVLTVVGRPTPEGDGARALGRAVNDLLLNPGGPVVVVPYLTPRHGSDEAG